MKQKTAFLGPGLMIAAASLVGSGDLRRVDEVRLEPGEDDFDFGIEMPRRRQNADGVDGLERSGSDREPEDRNAGNGNAECTPQPVAPSSREQRAEAKRQRKNAKRNRDWNGARSPIQHVKE